MIRYAIVLAILAGLVTGAYVKGGSDKAATLTAKYVKDLESVQIRNQKLAEAVAQKESEITNKEFDYEEAIDSYISNVRTNTIRLRLKQSKASVPKNEPAKCGNNADSETYLDPRISEELGLCNQRRNKLVFQVNKLQSYIKLNLKNINGNGNE